MLTHLFILILILILMLILILIELRLVYLVQKLDGGDQMLATPQDGMAHSMLICRMECLRLDGVGPCRNCEP